METRIAGPAVQRYS